MPRAAYIMQKTGPQGEPPGRSEKAMTLPEDIYSQRILELAAALPRTARLPEPEATATAHSKLCGSRVTVDLAMTGDVVSDYGQSVKACLLGQASSSVMGR